MNMSRISKLSNAIEELSLLKFRITVNEKFVALDSTPIHDGHDLTFPVPFVSGNGPKGNAVRVDLREKFLYDLNIAIAPVIEDFTNRLKDELRKIVQED